MRFDKALTEVFNGKTVYIKPHKGNTISLQHNTIAKADGANYRPTVTEMHSDAWEIINENN